MAEKIRGTGSVKRFGTRYGRTTKDKLAKIEAEQRRTHKCPYCAKTKVKRQSFGIWHCENCNSTFTSRAYTVGEKVSIVERAQQLIAEAPELETTEESEE